ncbi:MAG: aminoglycoside phosphotransferase family protein [Chloroflexi bacterium]|nr:aminoglycoside phosphotransferase family protein [Chloroflexota bacterium]
MLSPEQLTDILREHGHDVTVAAVEQSDIRETNVSETSRLLLTYEGDHHDAPPSLFLKLPRPESPVAGREIEFYQQIAPVMQGFYEKSELPFVYVYALGQNEDSVLLMDDLTETHFTFEERAPTAIHYELAVEAFGRLHAFWWNHPDLASLTPRPTNRQLDEWVQLNRQRAHEFLIFMGKKLDPRYRAIIEQVANGFPRLYRHKLLHSPNLTLIHRDPHPHNFLHPRDIDAHNTKIVDWQSWRMDFGAFDLAYMMAVHWLDEQRYQLEKRYLRDYLSLLVDYGIESYTFDELWEDYRLAVWRSVFVLVNAWSSENYESGWWWQKLRGAMDAYDDLGVGQLVK